MAYDDELANRIREVLQAEPGLTEKRMFGGLAFLLNGNMAVAASSKGGLMLRVDPADLAALLQKSDAAPFEMRGRPLNGWLRIAPTGVTTMRQLRQWVAHGVAYARSLPPK